MWLAEPIETEAPVDKVEAAQLAVSCMRKEQQASKYPILELTGNKGYT